MSSSSLHANWSMTAGAGLSKDPSQRYPQTFTPIEVDSAGRTSTSPRPVIPESHPLPTTEYGKQRNVITINTDELPYWGVNANTFGTGVPFFYNGIFLGVDTKVQPIAPNLRLDIPPRRWRSPPTDLSNVINYETAN